MLELVSKRDKIRCEFGDTFFIYVFITNTVQAQINIAVRKQINRTSSLS